MCRTRSLCPSSLGCLLEREFVRQLFGVVTRRPLLGVGGGGGSSTPVLIVGSIGFALAVSLVKTEDHHHSI